MTADPTGWLPRPRTRAQWGIAWVSLALVYFLAARLGLSMSFVNASASPVWPPTGVAIAALLVLGLRSWPGVTLGAYLANALTTGWGWPSLAIAGGNTLEALAAAWLVTRFAGGVQCLRRPTGVLAYALLAGLAATTLSASIGVGTLVASGNAPAAAARTIWTTWWLGDAAGALLVGFPLLAFAQARPDTRELPESLLGLGIVAALAGVVFSPLLGHSRLLLLLPLAALAWTAWRLGSLAAASAALVLATAAILGTLARYGPLVTADPNTELLVLQAYLGTASLTALVLAAVHVTRAVPAPTAAQLQRRNQLVATAAAAAIAALAVLVLVGWFLDVERLKAPVGTGAMKANTAVGLLAAGVLLLATRRTRKPGPVGAAAGGLMLAIGLATLAQYILGIDLGIDELLVRDDVGAIHTSSPGRMSFFTAIGLTLLASSVLARAVPRVGTRAADVLSLLVCGIGLLGLTSQAYGATLLASTTQVALHTAIALFAAGLASILLNERSDLAAVFASPDVDGRLARMLPVGILGIPLLLGLTGLQLQAEGRLTEAQGALLSVFGTMVLVVVVALATVSQARIALAQRAKAEAALRQSIQRTNEAERVTRRGSWEWDVAANRAVWSQGMYRLFGLDPATFVNSNENFLALVHPDDRTRLGQAMAAALAQPGPFFQEYRLRRPDGQEVYIRGEGNVLASDGKGTVLYGFVQDVTRLRQLEEARAQAERKVRESALRFQSLFAANPVALAITREADARFLDVNPAYEKLTGYARGELLDPTFDPGRLVARAPEREQMRDRLQQASSVDRVDFALRRKDGSLRTVVVTRRRIELDGAPCLLAAALDVTAERQAEDEVRRAQERFARVFEASPVGISLSRADGRVVDVNPAFCAMSGYTREELLDPAFAAELYNQPEQRRALLADLVNTRHVHGREFELRRKDGDLRTVVGSLELVDVGGATTILGLFQDVTELRQAQGERESRIATEAELERLRRTDRFRVEFINSTSHELMTPLTPLVLNLHLLQRDTALTQTSHRLVESMARAVTRLQRVVGDMVGAADVQARTMSLDRRRLNLNRELKAAVAAHLPLATRSHVELEDPEDTGETVSADPQRLQLVLGHLLGNAIKFTPSRGRVWITTQREGDAVRVSVHDTGIGMTAQQQETLWKPFSQAHDKSQRTDSGSGLGLYVTKGIIDLHGGTVGCESPGPGKGSTFWFTLPLATGHLDPLAKPVPEAPAAAEPRRNLNPGVGDSAED